jgi:serine/threonine protein kinase
MASGSTSSNVVGVHYRVGKKIGEGSFGVIFEGTNLLNQQQVAIKFEPRKSDAPQLRDEYRTYKILVGCRKFSCCPLFHLTPPIRASEPRHGLYARRSHGRALHVHTAMHNEHT